MQRNGEPLQAWNPFCEDQEHTELVAQETVPIEWDTGDEAEFTIRAFVLPRREWFLPEDEREARAKAARLSNKMQGIYIYRENRLIHPADWLGMFTKEPHFTLLRVEFSFDHRLDSAFHVDIKKSRILLNEDLYNYVLNDFLPAARNAAEDRYRRGQKKKANEKAKGAHADSNVSIGSKEEDVRLAEVTVRDEETGEAEVKNKFGKFTLKLKFAEPVGEGEFTVQATDQIDDGMLWEPAIVNGHHAVRINTTHPYYHKVYVPNLSSGVTVQGMDSLLWALAEAELGTMSESTKESLQDLRYEVSRLLRRLVSDLPEPDLEEQPGD